MTRQLIDKFAIPVPRYTSYPTAPHFDSTVGPAVHAEWLRAIPASDELSLYVHIPYCDTLCWFCGCNTKITQRHAPVSRYLKHLFHEIAIVAATLPAGSMITHCHWGGGSPTLLTPDEIQNLAERLKSSFNFATNVEFAVEIDPRDMAAAKADALVRAGMTRASIGVQDFNETVQAAINRHQSFEQTNEVVDLLRARGVSSVNIDAMYGLPHQTLSALRDTIDKVVALTPDRVALFGYAHVPWMKKHQRLIDETVMAGPQERFEHACDAGNRLEDAGLDRIGFDHFAAPQDSLSLAARSGRLKRNFQGYTADGANTLIGLGASSISKLPQGYVQNESAIAGYERRIMSNELATTKGVKFSKDDVVRAAVIERLMCDFEVSRNEIRTRFGDQGANIISETYERAGSVDNGLCVLDGDVLVVTEAGRPFVRTVCSWFDAYFQAGSARHSIAV